MPAPRVLPRLAEASLSAALEDTPVVLLQGPRQCGKTTLASAIGRRLGYEYLSLDEDAVRDAALADPAGFVADLPERVILDEIQRAPELFLPIKVSVDRHRIPGRFLLTGSTNILLLPRLADSLAGRMGTVRLHPFAQCELEGKQITFLNALLAAKFRIRRGQRLGEALAPRIVAGGYPAAIARHTEGRRRQWYDDYIDSLIQRDVRDMTRITSFRALPKLLRLAAAQSARLLNVSELAGPFELSRPTIRDYVSLLERLFLLQELPPWHTNALSRLIKTPKLHVTDTGLACSLLGLSAEALWSDRSAFGQMLESFVHGEVRRQASAHQGPIEFSHFRDKDGAEVDLVLEYQRGNVAGIEVKASSSVKASDFRGLRQLQAASGKRFICGVVLYDGETTVGFGNSLYAVPISELWSA